MPLVRQRLALSEVRLKTEGDGGTFEGYGSVFGTVHHSGDTVLQGAFAHTLRTHGKPKMYLEHSWATGLFSGPTLPIGKYTTAREDDHGLFLKGELTPGMTLAQDVRAALKHETLDGLSIGFLVKKGDYDETEKGMVIRRVTKLIECSVVAFPDDDAARITTVKGERAELIEAIEEAESLRELERLLRDAAGFTKSAATAFVARVKAAAAQGDPVDREVEAVRQLREQLDRIAAL